MPPRGRRHRRQQQRLRLRRQEQLERISHHQKDNVSALAFSDRIIVLDEQRETDDGDEVTGVSRSMPGALSSRMDNQSWNSFCDKIDESLMPFYKMKKIVSYLVIASIASFVPLFLLIGVAIAAKARGMNTTVFLIVFGIALGGSAIVGGYVSIRTKKVNEGLDKACAEVSKIHPDISFKIYLQLHYIEVCVPNNKCTVKAASGEDDTVISNSSHDTNNVSPPLSTPDDIDEAKSWKAAFDTIANEMYYYHEGTNEVTWIKPVGFDEAYSEEMNEGNLSVVSEERTGVDLA